jgi:hypothetical protein
MCVELVDEEEGREMRERKKEEGRKERKKERKKKISHIASSSIEVGWDSVSQSGADTSSVTKNCELVLLGKPAVRVIPATTSLSLFGQSAQLTTVAQV